MFAGGFLALLTSLTLHAAASPLVHDKRAALVPTASGGPTVFGGGTYPRANKLSDGSLIGTFTSFEDSKNTINIIHSTDSGATWTHVGIVNSAPSATRDLDNPYVLQLPSGRILCAMRNHDRTSPSSYTTFRIDVSYSDDNGATWEYLSTPASDPGPVNGNWEPFLRNALDGTLQIYYSRELNNTDQDNLMRTSTDGGKTWSGPSIVTGGNLNTRDGMIGVAPISGASVIAVFECNDGNGFTINSVTSADDGKTWGNRQRVYTPPPGNRNNAGSPQVINVGGTLVTSFDTDEDLPVHQWDPSNTEVGGSAKLVTSGDGGNTWGNKLTFSPPNSYWPGLVTVDDHSFLGMADHGGAQAQKVTLG